ncbi:MAG: GlsB/YeaQ/YmgE family stress response membrane protein [Melioribacteraceae bacterium]|nr:GlsB/YeaQ/YmgE family stress response membrane protein [Melioribacteraceae bacterium]
MNWIAWLLLGAVSGWLANILSGKKEKKGCFFNMVLGVIGAFIGGFIFESFGGTGITGFNLWSILVATIGAMLLIWLVNNIKSNN